MVTIVHQSTWHHHFWRALLFTFIAILSFGALGDKDLAVHSATALFPNMAAEQGYVRPDLRDAVMGPIRRRRLGDHAAQAAWAMPAEGVGGAVPYAAPPAEVPIPPDPEETW